MRIESLTLENFRGYRDPVTVNFDNLTAFIGKNDVGKSTILEALDIFFNQDKGCVKFDANDIYKSEQDDNEASVKASIKVCFGDLPNEILIDSTQKTTLKGEYLLNKEGKLEIIKRYSAKSKTPEISIRAYHPTNSKCNDLLLKKDSQLRSIVDKNDITAENKNCNAAMRKAIWEHFSDSLQCEICEIKISGELKDKWDKLQRYLPVYSLFQADRKNTDGDSEVQDPLKEAVKEILADEDLTEKLDQIAKEVQERLSKVSERTLEKLKELDGNIADSLNPVIPPAENLKWVDVFKSVSIAGDNDIPLNKRGSGVKRLVLLSFFRAQVEARLDNADKASASNIIYAIEEPETSQHTSNQKKLIDSFKELANVSNTQIIITTHSTSVVKQLDFDNVRVITDEEGSKSIRSVDPRTLPYPSLNEINYVAFRELSTEYHDELYGQIEYEGWLKEFESLVPDEYRRLYNFYSIQSKKIKPYPDTVLTKYIRHQIHHPENRHNEKFTQEDLEWSIKTMREFLLSKKSDNK